MRDPDERAAQALGRLSAAERLVFTAAYYEHLEDPEIASLLEIAQEEVERYRTEAARQVVDASRGENLRPAAERELVDRFRNLHGIALDPTSRLANLRPTVLSTIGDATLEAALRDIAHGDGNEMLWTRGDAGALRPPSLHSVFSSCGLALNAFGPWRLDPSSLTLLGETGYTEMQFEVKLRISGLRGRPPNLDVVVDDAQRVTAVESKLTEHLTGGQVAAFRDSYEGAVSMADETWRVLYQTLKSEPTTYDYLDAAQLVRHYLGLKSQVSEGGLHAGKRATLVYLYWEPKNAEVLSACRAHADELRVLTSRVDDPTVPLVTLSYRELLKEWREQRSPGWLSEHVGLLEARYSLPLKGSSGTPDHEATVP